MPQKRNKPTIRIELTEEQKEQVRHLTGKDVAAVKLQTEELEERVQPGLSVN